MNIKKRISLKRYLYKHPFAYYLFFPIVLLRRIGLRIKSNIYDSIIKSADKGNLVISLPDFLGSFKFDFRSDILKNILIFKTYEPSLTQLIKAHLDPNKDVIDVGANVGLFSVLFSKLLSKSNKVLAIEPTPSALRNLYYNVEKNDCLDSIRIFEGVASDSQGNFQIKVIAGMEEYSTLGNMVHPSILQKPYDRIDVKGETIDNLASLFDLNTGFIKIDTEGAEYKVLKGARRTIERYHPYILSELSDILLESFGANSKMVIKLLEDCGYKIIDTDFPDKPISYPYNGNIFAFQSENK